jgi:arylesterase/paraoxonase
LKDGKHRVSKLVRVDGSADFHPLGVAVDKQTKQILVANTPTETANATSIDVYSNQDNRLSLVKSIKSMYIFAPNSIYILPQKNMRSPDGQFPSFIVTNDHYFVSGWKKALENNLLLPLGSLAMYDARSDAVKPLLRGFAFANGVTGNTNGTLLYVAETYGQRIWKFSMAVPSGEDGKVELKKIKAGKVNMAVDNLSFQEETGDVIAAGHPIGYKIIKYARSDDKANLMVPPSMVLRWKANGSMSYVMTDDGSTFGTSTTGIIDSVTNSLIVSGLYENGILICDTEDQT